MPVLVVVCEAGESRHGAGVVVSDPLDHLPHFLPPLLLFQNPCLLVTGPALPEKTKKPSLYLLEFLRVTFLSPSVFYLFSLLQLF